MRIAKFEFRNLESGNACCPLPFAFCLVVFLLSGCESEVIRQQEEQLRRLQEEIALQRQAIEELTLAKAREEKKRQECNRAFADFEKAQSSKDPGEAASLYRRGLKLCPDDDVAHYELGKILQSMGQAEDARMEFEAALDINPNFHDARRQLERQKNR